MLAFLVGMTPGSIRTEPVTLTLAEDGRTAYVIALAEDASETEAYAADELAAYLHRISGATFPVTRGEAPAHAIILQTKQSEGVHHLSGDAYAITVRGTRLYLTGGNRRGALYAAYDLLARLGCRWLAPELAFYEGAAEYVPNTSTLVYEAEGDVIERPVFAIRKLDVAGARTHTAATLRKQIAWMAKMRFNTLMVSMTSGLGGDVQWDDWRAELVPELEKRGMLLQVGGHGYQNFLNADMEDGALFRNHPDWFGRDEDCEPRRQAAYVFNTGNEAAVWFVIDQVIAYLKAHPEIDIFGFWPPDMARWAECSTFEALGTPQDRQARLIGRLHEAMQRETPGVRLETIAYEHALEPPSVPIPADVLVDFCPLAQNFDVPIYDPASVSHRIYVDAIAAWREAFPGTLGLYSYYRKYAWRSLPNLIPHYMQRDLQWHASIPLDAVSSYAEPGDWFTYEINHYVLGHLAWNPSADVDRLIDEHSRARYGPSSAVARKVFAFLEEDFRLHGSIPYSKPDKAASIARVRAELEAHAKAIEAARSAAAATGEAASLNRLALMLTFARRDLQIQQARADEAPSETVHELVRGLVGFLTENKDRGVFVVYGRNDVPRYIRHYTRDWSTVAPGEGL